MLVALVLFLLNLNRFSAIFSASVSIAFNCNFEHVLGSRKNPLIVDEKIFWYGWLSY